MVIALTAALDPDYPMPRGVLQSIAAARVSSEGLAAVEPLGELASMPEVFRWSWAKENAASELRIFDLVIVGADFTELARVKVEGCEARVEGALRDAIAGVAEFHWHVESPAHNCVYRSAAAAVAISR